MSKYRTELVKKVWREIDANGDGVLTVLDLEAKYNHREHEKYRSGEWTRAQVFDDFLQQFDTPNEADGIVTLEEFFNFYSVVSENIKNDLHFDLFLRRNWLI
jgi:hypothetical protein